MGKKKKKGYCYDEDLENCYDDPNKFSEYLSRLAAEGEFGPSAFGGVVIPPLMGIDPGLYCEPTTFQAAAPPLPNEIIPPADMQLPPSKPVVPPQKIPTKPVETVVHQESAPGIQTAPSNNTSAEAIASQQTPPSIKNGYGRLRFRIITSGYGPSLIFEDYFGNSIARPIEMLGADTAHDECYHALSDQDMYVLLVNVYMLIKMRMYPDAIFKLDPAGFNDIVNTLRTLDMDQVFNFMSASSIVSYIIPMGYIENLAPKLIKKITDVGGNPMSTLMHFVPEYMEYAPTEYRMMIDSVVCCSAELNTNVNFCVDMFKAYTSEFCSLVNRENDIKDIDDILDDYDSLYASLIEEALDIAFSYEDNKAATEKQAQEVQVEEVEPMIDPNLAQIAATTEYNAQQVNGGATNDNTPFRDGTRVTISERTVSVSTEHESAEEDDADDESAGIKLDRSVDSKDDKGGAKTVNTVSNANGTSNKPVQWDNNGNDTARRDFSSSCTTNVGSVLKDAFAQGKEKEGVNGNAGGVHVTIPQGKVNSNKEATPQVQSSGGNAGNQQQRKEKEEKERKEEKGSMVVEVTTCGRK